MLAWSVADIAFGVRTSPLTWLASLAFWSIRFTPIALVSVALVVVVAVVGVLGVGNLSIEAARRRAGLVSQLRFAVTLQDLRTVVLLRRQLSQEKPRSRPWIRLGRGGRLPAVWRRDWQGIFRFPAGPTAAPGRCSGAVAGLSLGPDVARGHAPWSWWPGWPSTWPPTTRSSRWPRRSTTRPAGRASPRTAGASCWPTCPPPSSSWCSSARIAGGLRPAPWCRPKVVLALAPFMVLVAACAAVAGAAVSTTLGAPNPSSLHGARPRPAGRRAGGPAGASRRPSPWWPCCPCWPPATTPTWSRPAKVEQHRGLPRVRHLRGRHVAPLPEAEPPVSRRKRSDAPTRPRRPPDDEPDRPTRLEPTTEHDDDVDEPDEPTRSRRRAAQADRQADIPEGAVLVTSKLGKDYGDGMGLVGPRPGGRIPASW